MRRLGRDKAYYLKIISDYGPGLSLHIHFMLVNPCKTGCCQDCRSWNKGGRWGRASHVWAEIKRRIFFFFFPLWMGVPGHGRRHSLCCAACVCCAIALCLLMLPSFKPWGLKTPLQTSCHFFGSSTGKYFSGYPHTGSVFTLLHQAWAGCGLCKSPAVVHAVKLLAWARLVLGLAVLSHALAGLTGYYFLGGQFPRDQSAMGSAGWGVWMWAQGTSVGLRAQEQPLMVFLP